MIHPVLASVGLVLAFAGSAAQVAGHPKVGLALILVGAAALLNAMEKNQ